MKDIIMFNFMYNINNLTTFYELVLNDYQHSRGVVLGIKPGLC